MEHYDVKFDLPIITDIPAEGPSESLEKAWQHIIDERLYTKNKVLVTATVDGTRYCCWCLKAIPNGDEDDVCPANSGDKHVLEKK